MSYRDKILRHLDQHETVGILSVACWIAADKKVGNKPEDPRFHFSQAGKLLRELVSEGAIYKDGDLYRLHTES